MLFVVSGLQITAKLCSDVLGAVVDGVLPLDDGAAVVKDTLAILSSGDIKLSPAALKVCPLAVVVL